MSSTVVAFIEQSKVFRKGLMDSPLWGVIQADPIVKGWLNMLRQVETEMTQNNATQS